MTDFQLDTQPAWRTATVSIVVAAAVGLALGVGTGQTLASALGIPGALLVGIGAWGLEESVTIRQAGGSVATVAGAVLIAASLGVGFIGPETLLLVSAILGVVLVTIDGTVGIDRDRDRTLSECIRSNVLLFLIAGASLVMTVLFVTYVVPLLVVLWVAVASHSTLLSLAIVQLLLVFVSLLLRHVVVELERWVPRSGDDGAVVGSLGSMSLTTSAIPNTYFALLGVQLVGGLVPWSSGLFEQFFGSMLGPLLGPPVLQHTLALVTLGLVGLIVAGKCQRILVAGLGDDPSTTLGVTAGGIVAVVLAVVVEVTLRVFPTGIEFSQPVAGLARVIGLSPIVLLSLTVVLVAVAAVINLALVLADHRELVPARGSGFATGSALLGLTAIVGAALDMSAIAVFLGVAGAILTWDLGTHALSIGRHLGRPSTTDRAEFVHVSASVLVLGGSVVLVTAVHSVVVPSLSVAGSRVMASRAVLGLALLAVAVCAFLAASYLRERAA